MAFTLDEENILKMIVAEYIARMKLNKVNLQMGTEIRSEFAVIDEAKRLEYKPIIDPLQAAATAAQDLLKAECEK